MKTGATRVARDVWRVTTPLPFRPRSVHAYLVRSAAGGWILVDGGADTEAAWRALDAGVREVAGGWEGVRLHLVTHMHVDHIGLAPRVRAACGAPVAMGRLDAERVAHASAHPEEEAAYRAALLAENGAPADLIALRAGGAVPDRVPVQYPLPQLPAPAPGAEGWRTVWTPGHTAGHTSLFREEDRVLLAGDAVLPRVTPTIGVNRQRADPVGDYLDSLDRLGRLNPALGLGGHGEPIADVPSRLAELRGEAEREGARVAAQLGGVPSTAWEVARARYAGRDLPGSAWMQALRETRAHLDHLVATGRAAAAREGGVVRFWLH